MHVVTGGLQVSWHTVAGSVPSGPALASGSESGRFSLASKSHVQSVVGGGRPQARSAVTRRAAAPRMG